jgi:hypothetical protein
LSVLRIVCPQPHPKKLFALSGTTPAWWGLTPLGAWSTNTATPKKSSLLRTATIVCAPKTASRLGGFRNQHNFSPTIFLNKKFLLKHDLANVDLHMQNQHNLAQSHAVLIQIYSGQDAHNHMPVML